MFHRTPSSRCRAGFTLVEALVVVAILAILFGLTTAAVMRALQSAEDARVQVEIKQLEAAISACKTHFGVGQLPSSLRLKKNNFYDVSDPIQKRTKDYLSQMFPRMPFGATNDGTVRVNWTASGSAAEPLDLDPSESLVFFLGGSNGFNGWSPNPVDPVNGAGSRVAPFYEFNADRLKIRPGRRFPGYIDTYNTNQPYLYFTAYRSGNDYSVLDQYAATAPNGQGNDVVRAFFDPNSSKFINPNSFQIISAGRDGLFGEFQFSAMSPFVLWRNGAFSSAWATGSPQRANAPNDNLANFHPTKLSIPQ